MAFLCPLTSDCSRHRASWSVRTIGSLVVASQAGLANTANDSFHTCPRFGYRRCRGRWRPEMCGLTVPAPWAVPTVPLLGCTAGTPINGFRAAAQFNRHAPFPHDQPVRSAGTMERAGTNRPTPPTTGEGGHCQFFTRLRHSDRCTGVVRLRLA